MDRKQEAERLTTEAKDAYRQTGRWRTVLAGIYARVIDERIWDVDFDSFSDWVAVVGDDSASHAYAMADTYREAAKLIPAENLEEMTFSNARDFASVPESKRTAKMAKDAVTMPNNRYRASLNTAVPGLALEQRRYKGFQLDESQAELVERTIREIRERESLKTDSAALEWLCGDFWASGRPVLEDSKVKERVQ